VLVPPKLREYAGLTRQAMLIGQGNRFELWDEQHWNERRDAWLQVDEEQGELPAELGQLSL
jgi:MraZ protein